MNINKNAAVVLEKRYLSRDEHNKVIETPEGLFRRVAKALAAPDKTYNETADLQKTEDEFYELMTSMKFLPNSPTLMNAGKELGQLSACFVLPVEDSMECIFDTIKNAALIHKSGGGTGFSFSRLRPKGSTVNTTGGVASGPISFMKVFNAATEAVKQGGTRRGANMGILRIDHPDILEFIDCKAEDKTINNFNISVALTEEFMEAAEKGEEYELIDPRTKQAVAKLNAGEVFRKIVDAAWRNGEPGIIFIDRLNRDNIVPSVGEIESTNPCGEQPLLPYESCNLGSINLTQMVKTENGKTVVDYDLLGQTVDTAVHLLDNVIDANKYPLDSIAETTRSTRKIGLGVMGFADLLLLLGIPYNSEEGVKTAEEIMTFIEERGKAASHALAKDRGTFPLFKESTLSNGAELRNGTVTTIAPTGTLSIIAGVSSGVEPVFAYAYVRNVMDQTELTETNPILRAELEKRGLYSDALMRKIAKEGSLAHIDEIPEDIKKVFVAAHDVSPEWHIRMQAAFQRHTDNAVSKTVNFAQDATRGDVEEVYLLAWKLGCKGVTIYRDNSRDAQVLSVGSVNRKEETAQQEKPECAPGISPRPRPAVMRGFTEQVRIGCGKLYVTVNYDEEGICEVFTNTGKHGGCPSQSEAVGRLTSLSLRSGIKMEDVVRQLKGIRCPSTIRQHGLNVLSCPDAIAKVLRQADQAIKEEKGQVPVLKERKEEKPAEITYDAAKMKFCPECGSAVIHEGGCVICPECGFSKCG
ncbi:MAG: vitamin B12-dependent ribonucleotide reductase [Firmicutes bacterium]|nr:vitamin B12-dependent ribonucleotide reductase [Bacillota bacterium]